MTRQVEIDFTVVTPMFLAATADTPAEFRMPALRGAARYWFRVLAAPVFDDDFAAVAQAEAEVFGTAGAEQPGVARRAHRRGPSPVALRPLRLPSPTHEPDPQWLRVKKGQFNGVGYLLGPGLYQPPSKDEDRPNPGLQRPSHLPPQATGRFLVSVRDPDQDLVDYAAEVTGIALWAVAEFGGLGARTRRGFGGVRFDGLAELSPLAADPQPAGPDHPAIHRLHELVTARWGRSTPPRRERTALGAGGEPYPQAPSWSRWHVSQSRKSGSWVQLLREAGTVLREFRACVDRAAPPCNVTGLPGYKQHVTREYLDAVVPALRGAAPTDPRFEIGAFGLPVVYGDHGTVNLRDQQTHAELRRASPLWIRPYERENNFGLRYHVFETCLGPASARLGFLPKGRKKAIALELDEPTAYRKIADFLEAAP